MITSGILKRLELVTSKKPEEEGAPFVNMDIPSVAPIFAIAAFGIAVSSVILLIEITVHRRITELVKLDMKEESNDIERKPKKLVSVVCKRWFDRET